MKSLRARFVGNSSLIIALLGLGALACGSDDDGSQASGSLTVLLEAEDTIIDGIEAGAGLETIRDGWAVSFDKYLAAIGAIDVHFVADASVTAEAEDVFVVDLTRVPSSALPLWSLSGLKGGNWEFDFAMPGAAGATRHDTASQADFDLMKQSDYSYLIEGTLTKADGQSCPPASLAMPPPTATSLGMNAGGDPCYENPTILFAFGVNAATLFGPCEIDGVPGFSVPVGGSQTVAITIHGDHVFFNGFPAEETAVMRLAQWLADCDLDLDGSVMQAELESIGTADLPEIDDRFALGMPPIPLDNMWSFVIAQLKTQGHFQGEGECEIDGSLQ